MGMMRKTFSVGTLGLVSFRSNKELLRRAERSRRSAQTSLESERAARAAAEDRIVGAETRVKHATAEADRAAKRLEQSKRKRRRDRKAETMTAVIAGIEPIVRSQMKSARVASAEASRKTRKAGRRARKATKRSVERAGDAIEQLTPNT